MTISNLYDRSVADEVTGGLGDAYVTAHFDTDKLSPELKEGTKKAAEEAEVGTRKDFAEFGDKAGQNVGDNFGKSFVRDAKGRLHDAATGEFVTEAKLIGEKVGNEIGKATGENTESSLKKKISNLGQLLAPAWIKTIAVWVAVIGPAALQLASVLVPAVGILGLLIPVAIGGAAALGTLKIAMNGVSDAIKASGTAAYAADLKKLAPAARDFVKSFVALKPQLHDIAQGIQQAFFDNGFPELLDKLGKTAIPRIGMEMQYLSGTLGYLAVTFGNFFTKGKNVTLLTSIMERFTSALGRAGDAIQPILQALLKIGDVASKGLLTKLTTDFVNIAQRFGDFIDEAYRTGKLTAFFQSTQEALHQIAVIGKDAWTIVSSLLDAAGKAGGGQGIVTLFSDLASVLNQLDKSGALTAVFKVFNTFFSSLGSIIQPLLAPLSKLLLLLGEELSKDIVKLTPALVNLVNNGLVPLIDDITKALPTINSFVLEFIKFLDWISNNKQAVQIVFGAIIAWITATKTIDLISWLSGVVKGFKEWTVAAGALDVALDANIIGAFALAIGAMVVEIIYMVKAIKTIIKDVKAGALDNIGEAIAAKWGKIKGAVSDAASAVGDWFAKIGSSIGGFFSGIGSAIGDFFTKTVPGWWDTIANFLEGIPGKVLAILGNIASTILQGVGVALGLAYAFVFKNLDLIIINALGNLATKVLDFIVNTTDSWSRSLLAFIPRALEWVDQLSMTVVKAIVSFGIKLLTAIQHGIDAPGNYIRDHLAQWWAEFQALPGKLLSLGPKLLNAGLSIIQSLFKGLEKAGSFVGDLASSIFNHIKSLLNGAIGQINKGINKVGKFFPGGLPNIPYLADGAYVTKPTLALIGERAPEVVVPTDNPARAAQLLRQSGLTSVLAAGSPNWNINVKIGDRDITDIVETSVAEANISTAQSLSFGPRGS